jgi:exopolyphosphatase / guanosine-5'-triphosphate,3'-diphosphate pyrophosphatase
LEQNRIAIIDLGTNTFNLLVAEKNHTGIKRIISTKDGVGLGLGGINENRISPDAIERGLAALSKFCLLSRENAAEKIYAFGTSALRNAKNSHEFLDLAYEKLGLKIEVISGAREAELIYKGVTSGYRFRENELIMDIGGGSTEFIFAGPGGVLKSESFEIGVSRIYQLFQFSDPMTANDCKKITDYLENAAGDFFKSISCVTLIGASGSFETFYKLANNCEFPDDEYVTMTVHELRTGLDLIIRSTQKERDANPLIIPIRKKMAPLAAVKAKWVIDKLDIQKLVISPFALKEGVISEL